MMEWIARARRNPNARITGFIYLCYFLTAILAEFLAGHKLVAFGNATNLAASGCYVALTLLFYGLFNPVNRILSLIAALFSLTGCVVMTLEQFHVAPLSPSPLLFFGPYCLLIGYLILKSTFLPHFLGALMALAGFGWLAFLSPAVNHSLARSIEGIGIFAEASLMLWLLALGVNVQRWKEQANATATPPSIDAAVMPSHYHEPT